MSDADDAREVFRQLERGGWLAKQFEAHEAGRFSAWLACDDSEKAESLRLQAKAVNLFSTTVKANAKRAAAAASNDADDADDTPGRQR